MCVLVAASQNSSPRGDGGSTPWKSETYFHQRAFHCSGGRFFAYTSASQCGIVPQEKKMNGIARASASSSRNAFRSGLKSLGKIPRDCRYGTWLEASEISSPTPSWNPGAAPVRRSGGTSG